MIRKVIVHSVRAHPAYSELITIDYKTGNRWLNAFDFVSPNFTQDKCLYA